MEKIDFVRQIYYNQVRHKRMIKKNKSVYPLQIAVEAPDEIGPKSGGKSIQYVYKNDTTAQDKSKGALCLLPVWATSAPECMVGYTCVGEQI